MPCRWQNIVLSFVFRLMVRPGELVVIQRGIKFKVISISKASSTLIKRILFQVALPDGPSRGCESITKPGE